MFSLISVIAVSLGIAALGFITLLNNYRSRINASYFAICLLLGSYLWVTYLADTNLEHALFWVRAAYFVSPPLLLSVVLFVNRFPRQVFSSRLEYGAITVTAIISALSVTPLVASGVHFESTYVVDEPGPMYPLFLLFVLSMVLLIALILRRALKITRGNDRTRVQYVAAGLFATTITLALLNLFVPAVTGNYSNSKFGSYSAILLLAASSYAIVRHKLFDIRLVVARSIAYILLLVTLAGLYAFATFEATNLFFPEQTVSNAQQAVNIAIALILAFTFQPLRRFFEHVTDRIFYRDRYDPQEVINNVGQTLASEILLDKLLGQTLSTICERMHLANGQFLIMDGSRIFKRVSFGRPFPPKAIPSPQLAKLHASIVVADELTSGERKRTLDEHSIRVAVALKTKDQFVGHLLLGEKLSGDIYSQQDLRLLEILANNIAVAVLNAKAYEEIQRFNETLRQKIAEATARLRIANHNLKELDKAKDDFISVASHQLRTPLTAVKGYLSMLKEGDAGEISTDQLDYIETAYTSSERMVRLISDLLNVSRLQAGRFMMENKMTDLSETIKDELRQLDSYASAKGLYLKFEPPKAKIPLVMIDEDKTRQVMMNFIDNAIYYTGEGGITVRLRADEDNVYFTVTDTGIGVPTNVQKKLFTKFYRAPNAQQMRPDGTGLGLYLARKVIHDEGGEIIFESVEGQGSTFGFAIPIHPVDRLAPSPAEVRHKKHLDAPSRRKTAVKKTQAA